MAGLNKILVSETANEKEPPSHLPPQTNQPKIKQTAQAVSQ